MPNSAPNTVFLAYERNYEHYRDEDGSLSEDISVHTTLKGANRAAAERLEASLSDNSDERISVQVKKRPSLSAETFYGTLTLRRSD